jgi:hypothetical protein
MKMFFIAHECIILHAHTYSPGCMYYIDLFECLDLIGTLPSRRPHIEWNGDVAPHGRFSRYLFLQEQTCHGIRSLVSYTVKLSLVSSCLFLTLACLPFSDCSERRGRRWFSLRTNVLCTYMLTADLRQFSVYSNTAIGY